MSLRRIVRISLALQIVGSLATVLATIVIARSYRPEGQGYLSYFRSTVDLVVSMGLLGLPQAFVYMINSGRLTVGWALKISGYYSMLFTLVAACAGAVIYASGIAQVHGFNGFAVACAVLASAGLLAHGLYRAIVLVTSSATVFNLVTILPAVFLLIFYLIARPANYTVLASAPVVASLLSLIAAMSLFAKTRWSSPKLQTNENTLISAFRYGFWSFIPHNFLSLATVATYAFLRRGPSADAAVGQFSVAVLLQSTTVLPLNMIIPPLFNAWSGRDVEDMRRTSFMKLAHLGTLLSFIGLALGLALAGPLTMFIFGQDFMPSVTVTQIMLAGIFALYQSRLSSALLLSLGKPDSVAVGATIRIVVIMVLLAGGLAESISGAALAWTIGEFAAVSYQIFIAVKLTGWPVLMTLGLSPTWMRENLSTLRTFRC